VATVPIDQLRAAMLERAGRLGFGPPQSAELVAQFLESELRGAAGHGIERLRWLAGLPDLQPGAAARPLERSDSIARWDAAGALGYLALSDALDAEIADPPSGARLVVVRGAFPTGRLGHYAERMAGAGLVCLLTATSTRRVAHPAGGPPVVGTNPLCLGVPGQPDPQVIDVSMGRTTYGAVLKASATGSPLPPGTAIHADGSPAYDPAEVIADDAGLLPFGADQAYKGFALASLVELLCGTLAGTDVHSAVALVAQPLAVPPDLRTMLGDRRAPGDHSRAARERVVAAGHVDLPGDLWDWLAE